jgi:uncharacterized 2Fe-2S/4Fe-4S cluster protein (DUF4445 family)
MGVPIESICRGEGTCLKCKILVCKGHDHLAGLTSQETGQLSPEERAEGYRLACQARIAGDVEISVPLDTARADPMMRKSLGERQYSVRPAIRDYPVDMQKPSLEDTASDLVRLTKGLADTHEMGSVTADYHVLKTLPDSLRRSHWSVDVAVRNDKEIVRVGPRGSGRSFGLAVDIGTTTLAGYLVDLREGRICATHGRMNPQVVGGEDVMSRIAHCHANTGGLEELQRLLLDAIDDIAHRCAEAAQVSVDQLLEMVVVGNTCMLHFFLGLDPSYMGRSPFTPVLRSPCDLKSRNLDLSLEPSTNIHTLPMIGGFIGADTVAVLLATEPWLHGDNVLIMDIGTNGEIVLATKGRLYACSVATGPAFEGAHIRQGMRAARGAIERICITPERDVHWKVIGGEKPMGICGSGIVSGVAQFFSKGIIQSTGKLLSPGSGPRVRRGPQGAEFVVAWAEQTSTGHDISITQKDIENVLLAKAALYAGAKILMERAGVLRVERLLLAGAFGSFIDPLEAFRIGMFPNCDPGTVFSVGNAAGEGAVMALLDVDVRQRAVEIAEQVEYVELTVHPSFEHEYAMAMALPHLKDRFRVCEEVSQCN